MLLAAVAGEVAILVPLAGDMESGLIAAIFLFALSLSVVVIFWLMSRGLIEITDERLELRIPVERQSIRWTDIVRVQVRTISQLNIFDRFLATVAGTHQDRCLVEISLRRPIRLPFLPWQKSGPDAIGLPSLSMKVVRVYVSDPEGLVRAIAKHLQRNPT